MGSSMGTGHKTDSKNRCICKKKMYYRVTVHTKKLYNKKGKRASLFAYEERDEPKITNLSHRRQYCASQYIAHGNARIVEDATPTGD
jgi:hypothetical protein